MFRALGGVWTCFLRVVNRQRIVKQEVAIGSRAWRVQKKKLRFPSMGPYYGPLGLLGWADRLAKAALARSRQYHDCPICGQSDDCKGSFCFAFTNRIT